MPAVSKKQRNFMMVELRKKKAGKKTKTNMSKQELKKFSVLRY